MTESGSRERRIVRFRDHDVSTGIVTPAKVEKNIPLSVLEVSSTKVGGTVKLSNGITIPNPRLLDTISDESEEVEAVLSRVRLECSKDDLSKLPMKNLWELKKTVAVIQDEIDEVNGDRKEKESILQDVKYQIASIEDEIRSREAARDDIMKQVKETDDKITELQEQT